MRWLLLQILDDGQLTDGLGRKVDFKNTILIMTSNAGAREIKKSGGFGFTSDDGAIDFGKMQTKIMDEVKRLFNPEFINRVDEIVVFHSLNRGHMEQIIEIVLKEMLDKVSDREIEISLTKGAKEILVEKGFDENYGARPLRRVIQKFIEDQIAEEMLRGRFSDGSKIQVKRKGDELEFVEIERKQVKAKEEKKVKKEKKDDKEENSSSEEKPEEMNL